MNKMNKLPASSGLPDTLAAMGDQASLKPAGLRAGDAPSFASVMQQQVASVNAPVSSDVQDAALPRDALDQKSLSQGEAGQDAPVEEAVSEAALPQEGVSQAALSRGGGQQAADLDMAPTLGVAVDVSQVLSMFGVDVPGLATSPMSQFTQTMADGSAISLTQENMLRDGGLAADGPLTASLADKVSPRATLDIGRVKVSDPMAGLNGSNVGDAILDAEQIGLADGEQLGERMRREAEVVPAESVGMMAWLMGQPQQLKTPQTAAGTDGVGDRGKVDVHPAIGGRFTETMQVGAMQASLAAVAPSDFARQTASPSAMAPWMVASSAPDVSGTAPDGVASGAEAEATAVVELAAEPMTGKKASSQQAAARLAAELRQDEKLQASIEADTAVSAQGFALDAPEWQAATALSGLTLQSSLAGGSASRSAIRGVEPEAGSALIGNLSASPSGANIVTPARLESATLATPLSHPDFGQALAEQVSVWVSQGRSSGDPVTAELHLNPAEMGPIQVKIAIDGQSAKVDFAAAAVETRKAIEASLSTLSTALNDVGLNLTGGGVTGDTSGRSFGQQPGQSGSPSGSATASFSRPASAGDDELAVMSPANRLRAVRPGGLDLYA